MNRRNRRDRHLGGRPPTSHQVHAIPLHRTKVDHQVIARILLAMFTHDSGKAIDTEADETTPTGSTTDRTPEVVTNENTNHTWKGDIQ